MERIVLRKAGFTPTIPFRCSVRPNERVRVSVGRFIPKNEKGLSPSPSLRESSAICPTRIQYKRFPIPLLPFSFVSLTILTPILPIQRQAS